MAKFAKTTAGNAQPVHDLEALLKDFREKQLKISQIEAQRDADLEEIKTCAQREIDTETAELEKTARLVLAYAQQNFETLTEHGKRKSVELAPAQTVLKWYLTQPEVRCRKPEKEVVEALKAKGLNDLLRFPDPELNKNAIKKDIPETDKLGLFDFVKKHVFKIVTDHGEYPITLKTLKYPWTG
ncbi:MAG TPA: host-nuclease inhibitor Gam family protein [Candidatus Bathyarchaeia archaeon]|nr:host-nuclease inhibitor Gam family protein [Candidatus Bathyarchaeia archaeon]